MDGFGPTVANWWVACEMKFIIFSLRKKGLSVRQAADSLLLRLGLLLLTVPQSIGLDLCLLLITIPQAVRAQSPIADCSQRVGVVTTATPWTPDVFDNMNRRKT